MADYVSQFTGNEIDQNILKSANINKSSSEINASLSLQTVTVGTETLTQYPSVLNIARV